MAGGTLKSLLVKLGVDSRPLVAGLKGAEIRTAQTSKRFDGLVAASKRADAAMALQAQRTAALAEQKRKLTDAAKKLGVALTAVAVAGMAFLIGATKLAARVETLDIVVQQLGRTAGYSSTQLDEFETGIKSQGITLQKTRQAMALMMQSQIDLSFATQLATLAQNAAVIANIDSSEAFRRLTLVVQTGNVLMGRRMGLNLNFMKSQQNLAKTLGKTKDELTTQEVIQARLNEVLKQGATITGVYEAAMETAGKKMLSLNRHVEESRRIIGETFVSALGGAVDFVTKLLKGFQDLSSGQQATIAVVIAAITAFSGLAGAGLLVVAMLPPLIAGLKTLGIVSASALGPIGLVAGVIAVLITALVAAKVSLDASNKAFSEQSDKIARTVTSYEDYLKGAREVAEAEGMVFKTKEQLIAEWEAQNDLARISHGLQGQTIDIAKELARVQAGLTNIALADTEAVWGLGLRMEETAGRTEGMAAAGRHATNALREHNFAVDSSVGKFQRAEKAAINYFDSINTGIKSVIEKRLEDIAFMAAGGGAIMAAEAAITSAVESGQMSPADAAKWYEPLLVEAFALEETLGNLTFWETQANLAKALNIPISEARELLDGLGEGMKPMDIVMDTDVMQDIAKNILPIKWWERELSGLSQTLGMGIGEAALPPRELAGPRDIKLGFEVEPFSLPTDFWEKLEASANINMDKDVHIMENANVVIERELDERELAALLARLI